MNVALLLMLALVQLGARACRRRRPRTLACLQFSNLAAKVEILSSKLEPKMLDFPLLFSLLY